MRVSVLNFRTEILLRGAAIGLLAGFSAGCSSDFSRFAPTSNDYTGSINQQQIIHKQAAPARQAFPDQIPSATAEPLYNEPMYTGSVQPDGTIRPVASTIQRKALSPISGVSTAATSTLDKLPAPSSPARAAVTPQAFPAEIPAAKVLAPVSAAKTKALKIVEPIDNSVTGAVEKAAPAVAVLKDPSNLTKSTTQTLKTKAQTSLDSATAGTVNVVSGQTISGLAAKYGVPSSAILAANGMSSGNELKIGQKLIIPSAGEIVAAKPITSPAVLAPKKQAPLPTPVPETEIVAIVPATPQVKAKQATQANTSNVDKPGFKVISKKSETTDPIKTGSITKSGSYAVASGDSLYTIARKNGTTVDALKAANGLKDGNLKIGQQLKIPKAGSVVAAVEPKADIDPITTGSSTAVKKKPVVTAAAPAQSKSIDKTETAAIKPSKPAAQSKTVIEDAEKEEAQAPSATGISKLRWPVKGRTLVGYGQANAGKASDGIDISVPNGTPVKSAENGVVIYAGTGLKDFGNTVLVRHDNGLVTVYGHNGEIKVKRGQTVKRGQELAKSGMSGNTKVPKLHFEVRKNSTPVNPASLLE